MTGCYTNKGRNWSIVFVGREWSSWLSFWEAFFWELIQTLLPLPLAHFFQLPYICWSVKEWMLASLLPVNNSSSHQVRYPAYALCEQLFVSICQSINGSLYCKQWTYWYSFRDINFMYLWLLGKTFVLMMFTLPIGHCYLFFNLTKENFSYHLDSSLYKQSYYECCLQVCTSCM